ncbi:DinB family protein [Brevibacillus laterosporus]|uniref:DinB family protein n=1 Tax=Brevibacillus laterosporus TaxID=1465 RepID=UPI000A88C45D|nr:DinB family protein [Brevibacillus laterosporus]
MKGVDYMIPKDDLLSNFEGVRKRTLKYLAAIPEQVIDWRPDDHKFSFGDIVRHLGSAELMFYHAIIHNEWKYCGHEPDKGPSMEEAIRYLQNCHNTVLTGLHQLEPEQLTRKVKNLLGYEVSAWRIIMAMAEHEIHHRGQLSVYMQVNHIDPPQIFGLKIEQVPDPRD